MCSSACTSTKILINFNVKIILLYKIYNNSITITREKNFIKFIEMFIQKYSGINVIENKNELKEMLIKYSE
jgi:hypothetical protein